MLPDPTGRISFRVRRAASKVAKADAIGPGMKAANRPDSTICPSAPAGRLVKLDAGNGFRWRAMCLDKSSDIALTASVRPAITEGGGSVMVARVEAQAVLRRAS